MQLAGFVGDGVAQRDAVGGIPEGDGIKESFGIVVFELKLPVLSGVGGWAGIGLAAGLTNPTDGLGAVGGYLAGRLGLDKDGKAPEKIEDEIKLPAKTPDRLQLSSVVLSSQVMELQKNSEVQTKGFAPDAKLKVTPLDVAGQRIIPSVTRVFTAQQMLYIFFQAYVPEKTDPNNLRAGLEFFRGGHVNGSGHAEV